MSPSTRHLIQALAHLCIDAALLICWFEHSRARKKIARLEAEAAQLRKQLRYTPKGGRRS